MSCRMSDVTNHHTIVGGPIEDEVTIWADDFDVNARFIGLSPDTRERAKTRDSRFDGSGDCRSGGRIVCPDVSEDLIGVGASSGGVPYLSCAVSGVHLPDFLVRREAAQPFILGAASEGSTFPRHPDDICRGAATAFQRATEQARPELRPATRRPAE